MRKGELIFNYFLVLLPLVFCLFMVRFMGLYYRIPKIAFLGLVFFIFFGFVLFASAKYSIIKKGQLFTFGPSQMSRSNRIVYFLGYAGMGIGLFLLIVFSVQ